MAGGGSRKRQRDGAQKPAARGPAADPGSARLAHGPVAAPGSVAPAHSAQIAAALAVSKRNSEHAGAASELPLVAGLASGPSWRCGGPTCGSRGAVRCCWATSPLQDPCIRCPSDWAVACGWRAAGGGTPPRRPALPRGYTGTRSATATAAESKAPSSRAVQWSEGTESSVASLRGWPARASPSWSNPANSPAAVQTMAKRCQCHLVPLHACDWRRPKPRRSPGGCSR